MDGTLCITIEFDAKCWRIAVQQCSASRFDQVLACGQLQHVSGVASMHAQGKLCIVCLVKIEPSLLLSVQAKMHS